MRYLLDVMELAGAGRGVLIMKHDNFYNVSRGPRGAACIRWACVRHSQIGLRLLERATSHSLAMFACGDE